MMKMPCWTQFSGRLVATQPLHSSQPLPLGLPASLFPRSLTLSFSQSLPFSRSPAIDRSASARFQRPGSRQHGKRHSREHDAVTYLQSQHCGVDSPTVSHSVSFMNLKNCLDKLSTRARAIISDKQLAVIKLTLSYFRTVLPPKYPITSNVKYLQCQKRHKCFIYFDHHNFLYRS